MLYRDDDIRKDTDINIVEALHQLFLKYNRVHTLGIVLEDIYQTPIWYWMQETYKKTPKNIAFGLHAFVHIDYSLLIYDEVLSDLKKCLDYWNKYRGDLPEFKHFYPPYSKQSNALYKACEEVGLTCLNHGGIYPMYVFHWGELSLKENVERVEQTLIENIKIGN